MIVDQFHFRGDLYLVTADGSVYHVVTQGSDLPSTWTYQLVVQL
jgi:hypothetical protein